ncbi:BACON domain-containing protein [Prevotella scopos]|uniref:BACON domain-containing protein n=1 Tax=Prevotella scopos TaxID=589437 RepID=UPI000AE03B5E|nr:BACON domain-containing carbohydrate-binding protein [Prevotella scopos]
MKKYISIFMLVAAAVLGTACSSNDNELPEYAVGLNVVKAQTAFNVIGGTNEVKMASEPAQAYAQDAWLTVTKKAETLMLTAATNTSPQSRNTLLVIKSQQGDSITLNVQQEGITFGLPAGEDIFTDDKAVQKTLIATANVPVTYVTTGDWISVEQKGNEVGVKVTENTTGKARVGWVIAKAVA